jgi:hypothetical protein
MSAMFLPVSFCCSLPFFLSVLSLAASCSRALISAGVKSSNFKNVSGKTTTWFPHLAKATY